MDLITRLIAALRPTPAAAPAAAGPFAWVKDMPAPDIYTTDGPGWLVSISENMYGGSVGVRMANHPYPDDTLWWSATEVLPAPSMDSAMRWRLRELREARIDADRAARAALSA